MSRGTITSLHLGQFIFSEQEVKCVGKTHFHFIVFFAFIPTVSDSDVVAAIQWSLSLSLFSLPLLPSSSSCSPSSSSHLPEHHLYLHHLPLLHHHHTVITVTISDHRPNLISMRFVNGMRRRGQKNPYTAEQGLEWNLLSAVVSLVSWGPEPKHEWNKFSTWQQTDHNRDYSLVQTLSHPVGCRSGLSWMQSWLDQDVAAPGSVVTGLLDTSNELKHKQS